MTKEQNAGAAKLSAFAPTKVMKEGYSLFQGSRGCETPPTFSAQSSKTSARKLAAREL
jgi:hypothetical protein